MRRKSLLLLSVGALCLVGVAYAVTSRPEMFYSDDEVHGPRPAPNCRELTPQCPEIQPATSLGEMWVEELIAYRFEPPPAGTTPPVGDREAIDIAWQEGGVSGTSQRAMLVVIPGATSPSTSSRGSSATMATVTSRWATLAPRHHHHARSSPTSRLSMPRPASSS
jgi:hypothetical protein